MTYTTMSAEELRLADAIARETMEAAFAALKLARTTGTTPFDGAEWQVLRAAQRAHDPIGGEIQRREHEANLRLLEPLTREPLSGAVWDEAWRTGPGRDAL